MNPTTLHQMTERVAGLMEQRLGARGRGLQAKLAAKGRALPRKVRQAATVLAEAEQLAANPRLAMRMDAEQVSAAYDLCVTYLKPLGQGARVRGQILSITASIAFGLLVIGGALLGVIVWRGLL
jgi:hypothetical protein